MLIGTWVLKWLRERERESLAELQQGAVWSKVVRRGLAGSLSQIKTETNKEILFINVTYYAKGVFHQRRKEKERSFAYLQTISDDFFWDALI